MAWFKRSKPENVPNPTPSASNSSAVTELSQAEQEWLDTYLDDLSALGITNIEALGDYYDRLLTQWSSEPETTRLDPNDMINRIGVGFGEHVRHPTGTRWVIVADEHGTDLALHGKPGNVLIFPTTMIAKRWVAREVGVLPDLAHAAIGGVAEFRRNRGDGRQPG